MKPCTIYVNPLWFSILRQPYTWLLANALEKKIISPSIIPSELLNSHKKSEGSKKELATELERITCK